MLSSNPPTVTQAVLRNGIRYIPFELNNDFFFYCKQEVVSSKLLPVDIVYLVSFSIDEFHIYFLKVAETEC